MRGYELCLIFHPEEKDEELEKALAGIKDTIEKNKGCVVGTEKWGKKGLKFSIKKQSKGIYCFVRYMGTPDTLQDIERTIRFNESILRYNTVRVDNLSKPVEADVEATAQQAVLPREDESPGSEPADDKTHESKPADDARSDAERAE